MKVKYILCTAMLLCLLSGCGGENNGSETPVTDTSAEISGTVITETSAGSEETTTTTTTTAAITTEEAIKITVPEITGMTLALAESTLENAGIKYEYEQRETGGSPAGMVVYQSHEAGSEINGEETLIFYVNTLDEIEVPSLEGLSDDDALDLLDFLGIRCKTETADSDEAGNNTVLRQSPEGGAFISPSDEVIITIGRYTRPKCFAFYEPEVKEGVPDPVNEETLADILSQFPDYLCSLKEYDGSEVVYLKDSLKRLGVRLEDIPVSFGYIEDDFDCDGKTEYYLRAVCDYEEYLIEKGFASGKEFDAYAEDGWKGWDIYFPQHYYIGTLLGEGERGAFFPAAVMYYVDSKGNASYLTSCKTEAQDSREEGARTNYAHNFKQVIDYGDCKHFICDTGLMETSVCFKDTLFSIYDWAYSCTFEEGTEGFRAMTFDDSAVYLRQGDKYVYLPGTSQYEDNITKEYSFGKAEKVIVYV